MNRRRQSHRLRSTGQWAACLLAELERRWRTAAEPDLLAWAATYLPHYCRKPPSAMHRWLSAACEHLRGERGLRLNVLGPRGSAKSTLASLAWPLRCAVEGGEPYIWILSDTRGQACIHLENIKAELLDNPRLAADYPAATGRGPLWRAGAVRLNNGVAIEAYGTGQRLRGRRRRQHRPSLVICDDLQNEGHIASAELRRRSAAWFHGTLMKAGNARTTFVHLATALHREALAMELLKNPAWTSRVFRAIERWPTEMALWQAWESIYLDHGRADAAAAARTFYAEHQQAMDAGAELLWPEEEDLYALMTMRAEGGRAAFEREKQNAPLAPELCEWPAEYFAEPLWFDAWPAELSVRTMALDPSKGSDARRGDYSAYALLGVDRRGTIFVQVDLARRPTPRMVDDGVELFHRFRPDVFAVEANQYQELLADELAAAFARAGLLAPRPYPLHNRASKLLRIRRLGPYLASRRLRFFDDAATRLAVEQLKDFPLAEHDDGPDAVEMALRVAGELLAPAAADGLGERLIF